VGSPRALTVVAIYADSHPCTSLAKAFPPDKAAGLLSLLFAAVPDGQQGQAPLTIALTSIWRTNMHLGLLNKALNRADPVVSGATFDAGSNQKQKQLVEKAIEQLSPSTVEVIKDLDLSKVTPQQLRDTASYLFYDGQISREAASMLFSLGHDQPEGVEFDALQVLHDASEYEQWRPSDQYRFENLRLYRECQDMVSGLRIAVDFLRQGNTLSAVA
jgi:hypothetical protein